MGLSAGIVSARTIILMMTVASSSILKCLGQEENFYCETAQAFHSSGYLNFDSALPANTEIIGVHLHTGSTTTNGPVNIAFCGGSQLPGVLNFNGACNLTDVKEDNGRFKAKLETTLSSCFVNKVFEDGGNNATAIPGETLIEDGAETTLKSFLKELASCDDTLCNVYFNIHSNYSFNTNPGAYGVARGQLEPVSCPNNNNFDDRTGSPSSSLRKCFTASVDSANTNIVDGIPNQLPDNTASVTTWGFGGLIEYQGGLAPRTTGRRRRLQTVENGFAVYGNINFDSTLEAGNTEIIGAHLHTGSATTNGPVNIAFCGSSPLPGLLNSNGPCTLTNEREVDGRYLARLDQEMSSDLAEEVFDNGGNTATSVPGATTLADGASTTLDSFLDELESCSQLGEPCDVYFNIHTKYSFDTNPGAYGLARGQLYETPCVKEVLPEGYFMDQARCYFAHVTSANTNLVDGIPSQLPYRAGEVTPIIGDVVIVYQGGAFPPVTQAPTDAPPTAFPTDKPPTQYPTGAKPTPYPTGAKSKSSKKSKKR